VRARARKELRKARILNSRSLARKRRINWKFERERKIRPPSRDRCIANRRPRPTFVRRNHPSRLSDSFRSRLSFTRIAVESIGRKKKRERRKEGRNGRRRETRGLEPLPLRILASSGGAVGGGSMEAADAAMTRRTAATSQFAARSRARRPGSGAEQPRGFLRVTARARNANARSRISRGGVNSTTRAREEEKVERNPAEFARVRAAFDSLIFRLLTRPPRHARWRLA